MTTRFVSTAMETELRRIADYNQAGDYYKEQLPKRQRLAPKRFADLVTDASGQNKIKTKSTEKRSGGRKVKQDCILFLFLGKQI